MACQALRSPRGRHVANHVHLIPPLLAGDGQPRSHDAIGSSAHCDRSANSRDQLARPTDTIPMPCISGRSKAPTSCRSRSLESHRSHLKRGSETSPLHSVADCKHSQNKEGRDDKPCNHLDINTDGRQIDF